MIRLTIPGPPVVKGRPRVFRNPKTGRVHGVTPRATRVFESGARILAMAAARQQRWACTSEPVEVELRFYRAAMRGDLDNLIKSIDAYNGVLWVDDKQIIRIDAAMFLDRARPRTEIVVRLASEAARETA